MYVPRHFEEPRPEQLQALISENPLGVLVTHGTEGLDADHLPFELELREGSSGILHCHVARANSVWRTSKVRACSAGTRSRWHAA